MSSGASATEQLIGAVRSNNETLVQSLLEGKSPTVIAATINSTKDPVGNSLLHVAAKSGSYEALDLLLDQEGVEVDPKARINGDTPLHTSARNTDAALAKALVELLVECGADALVKNNDDKRPIQVATAPEVIQVLRGAQYAAEMAGTGAPTAGIDGLDVQDQETDEGESDNEI